MATINGEPPHGYPSPLGCAGIIEIEFWKIGKVKYQIAERLRERAAISPPYYGIGHCLVRAMPEPSTGAWRRRRVGLNVWFRHHPINGLAAELGRNRLWPGGYQASGFIH